MIATTLLLEFDCYARCDLGRHDDLGRIPAERTAGKIAMNSLAAIAALGTILILILWVIHD